MTEFALALGGGGARGLAHIHVLHAFDDLGIAPVQMAGSSIGAIMAAGYASGMSAKEIQDFALETFSDPRRVMELLWSLRPPSWKGMFRETMPLLGELSAQKVVDAFLPERIAQTFEDLEIPTRITTTDYYAARLVVKEQGPLRQAIAASIAIPAVFKPVVMGERILFDGGIMSPIPFDILGENGEIVIGVDVVGMPPCKDETLAPKRIEAAFGASQLLQQGIINMQLASKPPHLLVRPPVGHFGILDFFKARSILEETAGIREQVKRDIGNMLDQGQLAIAGK